MLLLLAALLQPPAISYDRDEAWLCRPGRKDACAVDLTATVIASDGSTQREEFTPAAAPAIDCFYVYPTVSEDSTSNSDMIAGAEERNVVHQQFARFASACRPFAPIYRQITLKELRSQLSRPNDVTLDQGTPYNDVLAAWRNYLARDNGGRGVVLIGHSQGAYILTALIKREIEGTPIQERLVSALVLGQAMPVARGRDRGVTFNSIPLCRSADQVGCVVTFGSFRSNVPPAPRALFARVADSAAVAGCNNPAALAGGSVLLDAYFFTRPQAIVGSGRPTAWRKNGDIETPFVKLPGLLSGRCVSDTRGSRLEVTVNADSTDARVDDIPGDIGAGTPLAAAWGLHLVDVHLVMGDLVRLVRQQGAAYGAGRGGARTSGSFQGSAARSDR